MRYAEFRKKLEAKFPFKNGDVKLRDGEVLVHLSSRGIKTQLRGFNGAEVKNPRAHFAAVAIMDSPGPDEIIHITEPGDFFDQVFWLDHEVLYSLDVLENLELLMDVIGYDEDQYRDMTSHERIEIMPFFKEKLANSLQAFFNEICVINVEDLDKKGKPKMTKAKKPATAKAAKSAKPAKSAKKAGVLKYSSRWDEMENIYLVSKNGKKFTYVHKDGPVLEIVSGNMPVRKRTMKRTKYASADKAIGIAEAYVDKMQAAGFRFKKKL